MMFELILIPILVGLFTQGLKLIIDGIPNNFNWQHLISDYGGMPSSHTAFVASVATVIGLSAGFDSAVFAVALALMVVVMRDAVGFRREIGRNAAFTNAIGREVFKNKKVGYLNAHMGHTPAEVLVGLTTGGVLSVLLYLVFIIM